MQPSNPKAHDGNSISIAILQKPDLQEVYDYLLEFGFDSAKLLDDRVVCMKNQVSDKGSHIESYSLEFSTDCVSMSYSPMDEDSLSHAEAAYLLVSFIEACPGCVADSQSLAHAMSIALGKSLQPKKQS